MSILDSCYSRTKNPDGTFIITGERNDDNKGLKFLVKRPKLKSKIIAVYVYNGMPMAGENEVYPQWNLIERLEEYSISYSIPRQKGVNYVFISNKDLEKLREEIPKKGYGRDIGINRTSKIPAANEITIGIDPIDTKTWNYLKKHISEFKDTETLNVYSQKRVIITGKENVKKIKGYCTRQLKKTNHKKSIELKRKEVKNVNRY